MTYKIPESVLVVVHTASLEVLLIERAAQPGFWQSVTGAREPDDPDLAVTAWRELREETGLTAGTLTDWRLTNRYEIWPQWRARYAPGVTHNVEHVFGFQVDRRTMVLLDPAEHTSQLWLPWPEAMEKTFSPTNRDAIWQLQRRVAATQKDTFRSEGQIQSIVDAVNGAMPLRQKSEDSRRNHILWVDDRPENNVNERRAFEAFGVKFSLSLSTDDALDRVARQKFAAIISDMGRREGPREGYVLLDALRHRGNDTPLFFYASSNDAEHKKETESHGGQGCTNDAQELFEMVTKALIAGPTKA